MKYSVIVLLEEKNESFAQFIQTLHDAFVSQQESFEIIVMANGTETFLKNELENFDFDDGEVKLFMLNKISSQAVCLLAAFKESLGDIIVACGSYQQITKESFNQLLNSIDDNCDIISPWRQKRVDPNFNQLQSRIFNFLAGKIVGSDLHDLSCTVKIFRREVLEETRLYGNMYRFLPIVAGQKGFKTKEVKCEHYQERGKTGFYKISEYLERIIDILTLYFNVRFIKKPLRFFSTIGSIFLIIGIFIICLIFAERIFYGSTIGDRPILLLALIFMVLGAQSASFGLLGEIIAFTHGRKQKGYAIKEII